MTTTTTTTTTTTQPDLAAVKRRQQQVWASADYAAVAARIVPMAEGLVQAAGLRAGERVLDVATGSGNAAIAAARCGCQVTGVDYVPGLLERGRARAARAGAGLPAGRHHRPGQLDAVGLHRQAAPHRRQARPAPGRGQAADPVGDRGASR